MPMMNRCTDLVNKIEVRLGTRMLNLPQSLGKDKWMDTIIDKQSLQTFSRYFPHIQEYYLTADRRKGPYYLIDEALCNSVEILGVGDINWHALSRTCPAFGFGAGFYSTFDFFMNGMSLDDIALQQMLADHSSIFKAGIYLDFRPPNMIRIESSLSNNMLEMLKAIPINLLVKHPRNLMTIPPTQMEIFEELATCDVAIFLFNNIKYFNNVETAFATTELNLDVIQDYANRRPDIVQTLRDSYVTAANRNQPIMLTI